MHRGSVFYKCKVHKGDQSVSFSPSHCVTRVKLLVKQEMRLTSKLCHLVTGVSNLRCKQTGVLLSPQLPARAI